MRPLLLLAVVLAIALAIASLPLFILYEDEEVRRADAAIVLAGEPSRLPAALELVERGVAPVLVISDGLDTSWTKANRLCRFGDPGKFVCMRPEPYSTRGEARLAARLARERGWRSLLVVTSRFHVFRARRLFERCFAGELRFVGVDSPVTQLPGCDRGRVDKAGHGRGTEGVLIGTFEEFARAQLPPPPARVLEVGCGQGELTTELAVAGYDVLGIDPAAPLGDRFRRILLEDIDVADGPFGGVVASHSLQDVVDLGGALDRIVSLLAVNGVLVLDELAWDRIDEPTLDWLYGQRRALASAGHGEAPDSAEAQREEWEATYVGVHGYETLRRELDARFEELAFAWTPYLYRHTGGVATEVLEQALIDAGAIKALCFRYAGVPKG